MPAAAAELQRLLAEFNERHHADLSMVVSRTGVSIAHAGPPDLNVHTFASLAATLMNAADVLYTGLDRPSPARVVVESDSGTLVASGLGAKAMVVALGKNRRDILKGIGDITAGIRDVLAARP